MALAVRDLPDKLYVDLGIGATSLEDICASYGLTTEQIDVYKNDPDFIRRVAIATKTVEDDGSAFQSRCRTVVYRLIPVMEQLVKNPDEPAGARVDAFKSLVKFGSLEPKSVDTTVGPSVSLTIIAPGGTTVKGTTLEHDDE